MENRWVFGIDNKDRDGFFIGRNLKPLELIGFHPEPGTPVPVQRAINGASAIRTIRRKTSTSDDF